MVKNVMRRPNSSRIRSERPFAGDGAHAGGHLLHDDEGDGGGDQGPQQRVAELGAGLRIGEDAAGIVIDVGGDEAGTEDGKNRRQTEEDQAPAQAAGAVRSLDWNLVSGWQRLAPDSLGGI